MLANDHPRLWMYRTMVKSRAFEDAIKPAYFEGKQPLFNMAKGTIPGEMHLSDGQEPCAVGVCAHLRKDDTITATHRPHHIAIAKGADLNRMTAEIFGRGTGLSGGRGGHMHLFDPEVNFACSGIIAQGLRPAVGAAMAAKMRGSDAVAVAFMGEGAANQGAFHEALNLAAIWQAPVIFVIEDNAYGISVSKRHAIAVERNVERAAGYAMPGLFVPGNDPDAIYDAAGSAIERARSGDGPSLLELETSRLEGHFIGDAEGYRPEGEVTAYAMMTQSLGIDPGLNKMAYRRAISTVSRRRRKRQWMQHSISPALLRFHQAKPRSKKSSLKGAANDQQDCSPQTYGGKSDGRGHQPGNGER